ncbi:MAG TPA: archaemetzincin family Zn-dependent metalloprotease [Bacteroidales bacterium]|nr:archaemetzincin family Zn-dependent metalloprotease [Bacteroidales bacterium]
MDPHKIRLIYFGHFENEFLGMIKEAVVNEFRLHVELKEAHLDLTEFYDAARRQYDGNKLLKKIDYSYGSDSFKTLGLFNVDIFIPILTFILGQAYLNGRSGIASSFRLDNELYGMKKDDLLYLNRFRKEVIHELGHMLGLRHCNVPTCVMRSVTYVEDIDQKSQSFCSSCRLTACL